MATYLITGAAGFIGSHLAECLLARGDQLRALNSLSTGLICNLHPKTDLVRCDITDAAAVAAALEGVDGVFHLAPVASVHAYAADWTLSSQINGFENSLVLESVARAGLPLVYALSSKVLGLTSVGLRFLNVYGPRQRPDSTYSEVITVFLERWSNNRHLTVFGDGSQTRYFVFVQAAAQALVAAMDRAQSGAQDGTGEVFNICSGHATSPPDLIAALSQAVCAPLEVEFMAARSGETQAFLGDPSVAARDLGFSSGTYLVTGLAETLAWAKSNRHHPIPKAKSATPQLARQENRL